jgi:hypothetical protein
MKPKFKIGDYICSKPDGQRYIIVTIDEEQKFYGCVDALCGREGYKAVLFEDELGLASGNDFEKRIPFEDNNHCPCVSDEYCDEFGFPVEWRFSNRTNREY